ncbi:MAG: RNA-binding protein [Thermodesulfovibrionales bacterium]|nr:RNA-binding protein [Thermodesulfovibrionales bacterium]
MSKKLYVGNLTYSISEDAVRNAFAEVGEVLSVRLITDESGKMKGFGFVEMASEEDAARAIKTLNGATLMGRNIIVNEARSQSEKTKTTGGASRRMQTKRASGTGRGNRQWK